EPLDQGAGDRRADVDAGPLDQHLGEAVAGVDALADLDQPQAEADAVGPQLRQLNTAARHGRPSRPRDSWTGRTAPPRPWRSRACAPGVRGGRTRRAGRSAQPGRASASGPGTAPG